MTLALSERDRERLSLFVDEMRAMRSKHGWSRAELAAQAQYSESLIAMVETYQRAPTQSLAKALDRAFQTPGFTEDAPGRPGAPGTFGRLWLKLRTISFPESFRTFAEHEANATVLRSFEHSLVPGLLQTEDYARAVLSTKPGANEAETEADVAERLARQEILTRDEPPPRLYALLDEGILHRRGGRTSPSRSCPTPLAVTADCSARLSSRNCLPSKVSCSWRTSRVAVLPRMPRG